MCMGVVASERAPPASWLAAKMRFSFVRLADLIGELMAQKGSQHNFGARGSRLVSVASLISGHGFSFKEQPYLEDLFSALRRTNSATFVVGAGVSINSGLPSWEELVRRLVNRLGDYDKQLGDVIQARREDLARKSEVAIQVIKSLDLNVVEDELVKSALYPQNVAPQPGQIASAVARIAASVSQIKIITTNFDELLEAALNRYFSANVVKSFTLSEVEEWSQWSEAGNVGVLHVHGLLHQGKSQKDSELVLTESQFLQHGAEVRRVIADAIADSVSIFVGLSFADPNLIGSLYQIKKDTESAGADIGVRGEKYFLGVVDHHGSPTLEVSARLAVESAKSLEAMLDLRPIILKSYSQLVQVLSDLALAMRRPDSYARNTGSGADSLYYGMRFKRVLSDCYSSVGCTPRRSAPTGDNGIVLTEKLRVVQRKVERKLLPYCKKYGVPTTGRDAERFSISLWLRERQHVGVSYCVSLVGTSVFQCQDPWTLRSMEPITPTSPFTAARVIFEGAHKVTNLSHETDSIWRGVLGVPILLHGSGSKEKIGGVYLDQLLVGALVLNSTKYMHLEPEAEAEQHGVFRHLSAGGDELEEILTELYRAMSIIFS